MLLAHAIVWECHEWIDNCIVLERDGHPVANNFKIAVQFQHSVFL